MDDVHKCRVCETTATVAFIRAPERMFGVGLSFDYFQCSQCHSVQIVTVPDDLGRYYEASSYYSFNNLRSEPRWRLILKRIIATHLIGKPHRYPRTTNIISRLRRGCQPWIATIPDLTFRSRILDVGCGDGARLDALANLGFSDLTGIDKFLPTERDGKKPNGVRLISDDLENHKGRYDLITMHHSLEHAPDPQDLLQAARERLNPGGAVFVRIPLLQSEIWARYGIDWVQLDPPRHLHLFSPDGFRLLAERAGLREISSGTDMLGWSLAWSEAYAAGQNMVGLDGEPNPLPFDAAAMAAFEREAHSLNAQGKGDQGYFVLQPA